MTARRQPISSIAVLVLCLANSVFAQGPVQPADAAANRGATREPAADSGPSSTEAPLGQTVVTAAPSDEAPIGEYGQPVWSARRRFPSTRVYVVPSGSVFFEYWTEVRTPFDAPEDTRVRSLFELEFGLGHRLQLDLYLRTQFQGGVYELESERVELRWAFADWGVIPGNPTLYLEWLRSSSGVMSGEVKLLLGGSLAPRWYWGTNLSFERELWGSTQSNEYRGTFAFARTLIDSKLSLGGELQATLVDQRPDRGAFTEVELLLGPSLQYRPLPKFTLNLVWMFGAAGERASAADPLRFFAVMQPTLVFAAQL